MIISGNKIARAIRSELREAAQQGTVLHIFVVGHDRVIENFVMKKRAFAEELGVEFIEHRFKEEINQDKLIQGIKRVSQGSPSSIGIVVQLPLPKHIDTRIVLDSVPAQYDIDGLGSNTSFIEPVAGAVAEILERKNIEVVGKQALVVGNGKLVGKPVAHLLDTLGAQVTVVDKATGIDELAILSLQSDIIVSGAGVPNLITPNMITDGVVLLDAGTSTQAGSVVGDIAYDCKSKARYFARTPGGIGPVTVAVLFKNLITGIVKI